MFQCRRGGAIVKAAAMYRRVAAEGDVGQGQRCASVTEQAAASVRRVAAEGDVGQGRPGDAIDTTAQVCIAASDADISQANDALIRADAAAIVDCLVEIEADAGQSHRAGIID